MLNSLLHDPLGVLLAIVALGLLIIVHEGGHFLVARLSGMRVDRFSIGFGPAIARFRRGETQFQIGCIPLGGFVQIAGLNPQEESISDDDPRSYPNRPVYQRLATIFAGPGTNYLFAALTMLIVYVGFGMPEPTGSPMVVMLSDGYPAQQAGLQLADEVLSVDGKPVKTQPDVSKYINEAEGRPVDIVVSRERQEKHFTLTPKKDGSRYLIGVSIEPREMWVRKPLGEEVAGALTYPVTMTGRVLASLGQIFTGKQKADFTGPVGIVTELKRQMLRGTAEGLSMVAFISTLLGLFNLLPLPALDGGRLVFLAYEGTVRRKFPQRIEQSIHLVGMLALLSFLLYVTAFKDIPKLFHH